MNKEDYLEFVIDYGTASFEWDEEKARQNFIKHGIKFETASKVFADPDILVRFDEEHSLPEEQRFNIIGRVLKVFFIVCVFKENNVIRLVSARLATKNEKERYEEWLQLK